MSDSETIDVSTEQTVLSVWEQLKECPARVSFKPIRINRTEFIVITDPSTFVRLDKNTQNHIKCLYKYNIHSNEWKQWIKYPPDFGAITGVAMDTDKNELYFFFNAVSLIKLNLNTEQFITIKNEDVIDVGKEPSMIYIDGELHIVGGDKSNAHYIYDDNTKEFQLIHTFDAFGHGFSSHKLIYLQSTKSMLLMGGYNDDERGWLGDPVNTIYIYSIHEKQWIEWNIKLPLKLYRYGYCVTNKDEFVLLFGGCPGTQSDVIHILNVEQMRFIKAKICLPTLVGYNKVHAVLVNDYENDEYLVSGYLRIYSELYEIAIPWDVAKLIEKWIHEKYVYVMRETGNMWRITLSDLICFDNKS